MTIPNKTPKQNKENKLSHFQTEREQKFYR